MQRVMVAKLSLFLFSNPVPHVEKCHGEVHFMHDGHTEKLGAYSLSSPLLNFGQTHTTHIHTT